MSAGILKTIKHVGALTLDYLKWRWWPRCDTAFLRDLPYQELFFNDYLMRYEWKCRKVNHLIGLRDKRLVITGCGEGNEIDVWRRFQPRCIFGYDLLDYGAQWRRLPSHSRKRVMRANAMRLPFRRESFDVIVSDAVFEHIMDLPACLEQCAYALAPNGAVYASFGPIYRSWGGTHVNLGLEHGYDHLLMTEAEYELQLTPQYASQRIWWDDELLNGLAVREYLEIFQRQFRIDYLGVVLSWQGICFMKQFPETWQRLLAQNDKKDLLIKSLIVVLRKR